MSTHELMGARRPDPLVDAKFFNAARRTVTLLVEGELDARLWRTYCVARVWPCGGRSHVLAELDRARPDDEVRFLAVLDADFDRLQGRLQIRQDVVWTDSHDLETTLLGLPVLEKLLRSEIGAAPLAERERAWNETFRGRLMRHGEGLGRLRWLNIAERAALGLAFTKPKGKRGDFTRFDKYDRCVGDGWTPCLASAIKAIINYSNAQALARRDLLSMCEALPPEPMDQLCNGHDLLGFLKAGVETIQGRRATAQRSLDDWGRTLVDACERQWLQTTAMWRALEAWDEAHPRYPLLARDA